MMKARQEGIANAIVTVLAEEWMNGNRNWVHVIELQEKLKLKGWSVMEDSVRRIGVDLAKEGRVSKLEGKSMFKCVDAPGLRSSLMRTQGKLCWEKREAASVWPSKARGWPPK